MNEEKIRELQTLLAEAGLLDESDIDGKLGPKTRAAIQEWQKYKMKPITREGNAVPETSFYNRIVASPAWMNIFAPVRFIKAIDRIETGKAPVRQVIQSFMPRSHSFTQTTSDFSANYMAQIYNLAATRISELRKQRRLPTFTPSSFSLEPSTFRIYNEGRGSDPTYADFDPKKIVEAVLGGRNAAEYTDGGMGGRIMIHPKDPSRYLVELTDISAWDLDGGKSSGSRIRDFMGKYGPKGSDPTAVRQKFYLSIPIDYEVTPGILQRQDFEQVNQDEAEKLFNDYSN